MPVSSTSASHIVSIPPVSLTGASHKVIAFIVSNTVASHAVHILLTSKTVSSHAVFAMKISKVGGRFDTFIQTNRVVYSIDSVTGVETKLGTLLPGQTTLIDVSIPNGSYIIEVRSSDNFYDETRSRIMFPVIITAGVVDVVGIPNIQDLVREITNGFKTKLRWTIPDSAFIAGLKFGIWRSATTPVDVSGAPDFETLAYEGLGKYSFVVTQTVDEFFAVAAIAGSEQGQESEVFSDWDLSAPASPANQFGYKELPE